MFAVLNHLLYLVLSVIATITVAHTAHRISRPFVVDVFHGDEPLADAVNRMLVIGCYLLNVAWVAFGVRYGAVPTDVQSLLESVTTKFGWVLLILGVMHMLNVAVLTAVRRYVISQPMEIVEFLDD